MSELKPCNCGHTPMIEDKISHALIVAVWYMVKCSCGMRTEYFIKKQEAINIWNTRQPISENEIYNAIYKNRGSLLKCTKGVGVCFLCQDQSNLIAKAIAKELNNE